MSSVCSQSDMLLQIIQLEFEMSQKKINGYLILMKEVLGRGSYGCVKMLIYKVFKGEQDGTKRTCAVKVIEKKMVDHDEYLKNALFSEIQIMQLLKSQNIVRILDVMESSNNYYIVQQLCDSDLEKMLKQRKRIPEEQAIELLRQICNGFLTLAKEGIVHRDIKPANLLISKGSVKIGDFGFAKKNLTKRMKNASAVGTPLYWPLQILKSQSYTSKCDVWAVGFIFYEMLHGKTPWAASTEYELIKNIEKKQLQLSQDLDELTKDFLRQTLQKQQEDRLSWDEVFMHPIFKGQFQQFALENKLFEDQLKRVMGELRFQINSNNINLIKLIEGLGFKNQKELKYDQFTSFLKHIHPKITKKQIKFFFEKMDANGDGSVSMDELESEMEKHRISFSKSAQQNGGKFKGNLFESNDLGELKSMPSDLEFKVKKCFLKLNKILTTKKLTLFATYNAYDTDRNGQLTITEFERILKRLDTSFTQEEIMTVFDFIDVDQSKTIDFDELNSYYCKVNGLSEILEVESPGLYRNKS